MTHAIVQRPLPGNPRPYRFPRFERVRLSNGMGLIVAPIRRLPLVTMRFVIESGARNEPRDQAGIAALAAAALAEGTQRLDASMLADEFERLGGSLSAYATWDATYVRTTVLSERLEPALALLAEVVRSPAFAEREVSRLRDERLAELLELKSEPRGLADERFTASLYHPASRLSIAEGGSESSVASLTREMCVAWHGAWCSPAATTLVMAGDVDASQAADLAESLLADWQIPVHAPVDVDDSPVASGRCVKLLHRPGAPQTELRLGHVGLRREHPDYFDVVVMNAILGGVFNSRINLNLREKNAFTYGAFSSYEWRRDAGPFCVSTAVATGVTAAAVREILAELGRIRAEPPGDDELSLSVSYLDGVFPIRFETTDAIAGALASLATLRLPDDYYDTYRERIRAVTSDSVLEAARRHVHTEALQILMVGDADAIEQPLSEMSLGPVLRIADDD